MDDVIIDAEKNNRIEPKIDVESKVEAEPKVDLEPKIKVEPKDRIEPMPKVEPKKNKNDAKKEKKAPSKKRGFFKYSVDLIEKSLLVFLLLGLNFALFAGTGAYGLFENGYTPYPEIVVVGVVIAVFSVALMFILSFSPFLQNLFVAFVSAGLFLAVFHQFALFEPGAIFYDWAKPFIKDHRIVYFSEYSHLLMGLVIFLYVLIFMSRGKRLKTAGWVIFWGMIASGIVFNSYIRGKKDVFEVKYTENASVAGTNGNKFVYIAMPNLASYSYLKHIAGTSEQSKKALSSMLGFFNKNAFDVSINAFSDSDNPQKTLAQSLNPGKKEKDIFADEKISKAWWDFSQTEHDKLYLKNNRIFDSLKRSKFVLNAYQSHGLDFCLKNNGYVVNKCVEKHNLPTFLDRKQSSLSDRVWVLLGQWLHSTGLVKGSEIAYTVFDTFLNVDKVPMVGTLYDKLYVIDAVKTLDVLAQDVNQSKGNQAFFAYFDLPSDMYVYDEFCSLKPRAQWVRAGKLGYGKDVALETQRQAYFEQMTCAFGALQNFMEKVNANQKDSKIVVFVQGLNGIDDKSFSDKTETLQNKQAVSVAVHDPKHQGFRIDKDLCSSSEILKKYLFKKGKCDLSKTLSLSVEQNKKLLKQAEENVITLEEINAATSAFDKWYALWQEKNGSLKAEKALPSETKDQKQKVEEKKSEVSENVKKEPLSTEEEKVEPKTAEKEKNKEEKGDAVVSDEKKAEKVQEQNLEKVSNEKASEEVSSADVLEDEELDELGIDFEKVAQPDEKATSEDKNDSELKEVDEKKTVEEKVEVKEIVSETVEKAKSEVKISENEKASSSEKDKDLPSKESEKEEKLPKDKNIK